DKPITRLAFTRGELWTYKAVEKPDEEGAFLLDLGFRVRKDFPSGKSLRLGKDDCVKTDSKDGSFSKVDEKSEALFTYKARIEKIIDADTFTVLIDLGFGLSIQQKLRLRGIDSPEMDAEEGKRATRFVQARISRLDFIVVKTHKDSTDKYDRYLADIFYLKDEKDPAKVAAQGNYLNQELLNERLACVY
ncbi:MAG: thermonuclease family protein, partial [Candidatus Omnitrophota bacterium]